MSPAFLYFINQPEESRICSGLFVWGIMHYIKHEVLQNKNNKNKPDVIRKQQQKTSFPLLLYQRLQLILVWLDKKANG